MTLIPSPQILAETDRWWVVNKPPGWLTIPGRTSASVKSPAPVLLEWLSTQAALKEGERKPWVIHRIDRGTSGLVLFAKSAEAHAWACAAFENRKVAKKYDALIGARDKNQAPLTRPMIRIDSPIEGKSSVTQVEVRKRFSIPERGKGAWIRARIFTGRRHQIRIHLSGIGYPLLGDVEYGGSTEITPDFKVQRVALHASELELPGGEKFQAPLPEDFSDWIRKLETLS